MKTSLRRIADFTLYFSFCFLLGSGLLMKFSFVKGLGPQTALGLSKPEWCDLHLLAGAVMLCAAILHLALNSQWICNVGAFGKKRLAIFIIALGIILTLFLAFCPVKTCEQSDKHPRMQRFHK
ncbi:DUF4405 domain-containing protein [Intestinicryptomonas porci]|uniref:DUF4405 domain-containing protein n=1 Tax=Intestinicryptomonas porci TaxID=2926320 RepID=A0ABU4WH30_9BACT|nr:DUF4405 domain-containing protein [Opitutales bacterium CLA-KB-P66]